MKKVVVLVLLVFILNGCTIKPSELTPFNQAISNYDETKTFGYMYHSIQTIGDEVINEDRITQRIDWINGKAYTETYEKRVGLLNDGDAYTEHYQTTYYHNDQIGHQIGEEDVTWIPGSIAEYIQNELPITPIYEIYFEGFVINELESSKQVKGTIKQPSKVIKNGDDVIKMDLTIEIDTEGLLTLIYIEIEYPLSTVTITYEVFYEPQTVVIP